MPRPLQQKAYKHLKKMIVNDEFEYTKIYSETKLSKDIGISRTPMRDAIHLLAQEGYIDIIPSKGFCIHQLTEKDIIETFQVRSALEGYCIIQLTNDIDNGQKIPKKFFNNLERLLKKQKEILDTTKEIKEFVEHDNLFHIEIVAYMNNNTFNQLFSNYLYQIKRLAVLSLSHEGRMEETYQEHLNIYEGMKTGNTKDIYHIIMRHMERPQSINLKDIEESCV